MVDFDLQQSCDKFTSYPLNITNSNITEQRLEIYGDKLESEDSRLFDDPILAKLDFLTLTHIDGRTLLEDDYVTTVAEVERLLPVVNESSTSLPGPWIGGSQAGNTRVPPTIEHRFFLIHALHSRAPLRISRDMLAYLFTYYQVSPSFLDSVFPFGERATASFHDLSVLRLDSHLLNSSRGLEDLARTEREVRVCYDLRSVERPPDRVDIKTEEWSIRQTAIYNSFDIGTGHTLWINIKGNQRIKTMVEREWERLREGTNRKSGILSVCLATHKLIVEWSQEDWRSFINHLDSRIQDITKGAMVAPVEASLLVASKYQKSSPETGCIRTELKSRKHDGPNMPVSPAGIRISPDDAQAKRRRIPPSARHEVNCTNPPPDYDQAPKRLLTDLSFGDLQGMVTIEELVEEATHAIAFNISTITDIAEVFEQHAIYLDGGQEEVEPFLVSMKAATKQLGRQRNRADALLTKVRERKALVNSNLLYRSMKLSEMFADGAQQSTQKMEVLSYEMRNLAEKTQQRTVSMHVITLVTLFFLPGTFVATFLSTDVLRWSHGARVYESGALQTYLSLTLPITAVTILTWYWIYTFSNRKSKTAPVGFIGSGSMRVARAFSLPWTKLAKRRLRDEEKISSSL